MIRIIFLWVMCLVFLASGTLSAFDVEWKTQDETVQYKKPVVEDGEVVKKEPFVDDKKIYEEKKKVLDDIYYEEMKPKPKYPEYETEEFEMQAEQPILPPAAGAFGTQGLPQAVEDGNIQGAGAGGGSTAPSPPVTAGPRLPASIPIGQTPGAAAPAGGCQGPTIGLFGGGQAQNSQQTAAQNADNEDNLPPPPANPERPRGLSSGQFYHSEDENEGEDEDSQDVNANSRQQEQQ